MSAILSRSDQIVTTQQIIASLSDIGITHGQTVLVHSSLKNMGPLAGVPGEDRKQYCQKIFESFNSILGIQELAGTLIVPTFSHNYVKNNNPFVLEETPSETGIFSEYVRRLPMAMRTLHPINSISVIGARQDKFLELSSSAYGINSAFDRLEKIKESRLVYFGATVNHTTILHHVEQLVGVSYVYNKAYFSPNVYINRGGEKVDHPFFSSVRYLNGKVTITYFGWGAEMHRRGLMLTSTIGRFTMMSCKVVDAISVGYEMLQRNPCAFLESPGYYTTE